MYNVSFKVWNTYYLQNIDMFTFDEIYTFDLFKKLSWKIYLITYCLKIHGNTCELNFWSWHYHPIMGLIQNMEATFQTSKKHL
jgi:hypothetical protein